MQGKPPVGLYNYRGRDYFKGLALQLRVEPDGTGLLVINANTVLYLNETAVAHTYYFMLGLTTDEAIKKISKRYKVNPKVVKKDYEHLIYTISTLAQTEEVCPVSYLDVERVEPFSKTLSAPVRMDLALTFKCQNDCLHCYTGGPQETTEKSTQYWMKVLDKMKSLGIFIASFTGGEPTLRDDLPVLLAYAQKIGLVTGLVTNGRRIKDRVYLHQLEDSGLDFSQVTLESHIPEIHDSITNLEGSWKDTVEGIKNLLKSEIYTTVNSTLNTLNKDSYLDTITFLHQLKLPAFSCNSLIYSGRAPKIAKQFGLKISELKTLLPNILEKASNLGMKFIWYTPTRYCDLHPVHFELGVKSCTAAKMNMCIGPEGDVYPCQSYFKSLGKFVEDDWKRIWNHSLAISLREKRYAPKECIQCQDFEVCGGGCPLELETGEFICLHPT